MASQGEFGLPAAKMEPDRDEVRLYAPLKYKKTFGIAVSGDVKVTETERQIIDTPEFQRLKGVRQLGPSIEVYPTALHTRFDHSLGTLKMADEMVRAISDAQFQGGADTASKKPALGISPDQHKLARLYALLHDVTHVPFGHTLEDELHIFDAHDSPAAEARFDHFLGKNSSIGKIIARQEGDEIYRRLVDIVQNGKHGRLSYGDEFIHHLVSDTVCADLLDYARRDSYFCNLGLGLPYRFLSYLYVQDIPIQVSKKQSEIRRRVLVRLWKPSSGAPRRDLLTDLAGLLEARYMIAERVYFHHAKVIAGTMLSRAVFEAKRIGKLAEKEMWTHSDDSLVYFLSEIISGGKSSEEKEAVAIVKELALAYRERRLHVTIKKFTDGSFAESQQESGQEALKEGALKQLSDPEQRVAIENSIADIIDAKRGQVLIYPADPSMNLKVARAIVQWNGEYKILEDVDEPVLSARLRATKDAHRALWGIVLMGHRDLTAQQKRSAEHVFSAMFVCARSESGRQKATEGLTHVVRERALRDSRFSDLPARELDRAVTAVAKELASPSHVNKLDRRGDLIGTLLVGHVKTKTS